VHCCALLSGSIAILFMCISCLFCEQINGFIRIRIQLNPAKTEVLWCASTRCQHPIPTEPVRIGDASVLPATAVRHLSRFTSMPTSPRGPMSPTRPPFLFRSTSSDQQRATVSSSARFAQASSSASDHQVGPAFVRFNMNKRNLCYTRY